jgi:Tn3 transposase DDE domain
MNRQLTVQESRHRLGRKICHGHRGQIRQACREGQEDQLAALGLVLNAVVLWNTCYLDAIVESLRGSSQPVRDEAAARLSPLGRAHLNCLGRYAFTTQRLQSCGRCATRTHAMARMTESSDVARKGIQARDV